MWVYKYRVYKYRVYKGDAGTQESGGVEGQAVRAGVSRRVKKGWSRCLGVLEGGQEQEERRGGKDRQ